MFDPLEIKENIMELWEKIKNNDIVKKITSYYSKYTNTQPVLDTLKSGKSIQKAISIVLRIFAVIFGIAWGLRLPGLAVVFYIRRRFSYKNFVPASG